MKTSRLSCCLLLGALLLLAAPLSPVRAMPVSGHTGTAHASDMTDVQYANSKGFRRCMRQKYGRHYFRGVKRAHRYFMAQACGG
jgi:hypothetical protein